jgi:hypothetical protein
MAEYIEKKKTKIELENLGKLVDRYAQSRSLGLLIPLAIIVINTIMLIGSIELVLWKPEARWTGWICRIVLLWVLFSVWPTYKLVSKYGSRFYRKDGKIELKREKIPLWAWVVFLVPCVGSAILSAENAMPVRWALALSLASAGVFVLYAGKKQKEISLCTLLGSLLLLEAIIIAAGLPLPFADKRWLYSFFLPLELYFVGAGLIAMVVVHIYNRKILHKLKEMRPFSEQQAGKSDS